MEYPTLLTKKRSESDIKRAIVDWLKIQPHTFLWVNHTTGIPDGKSGFRTNYSAGISDITGVKKGRAFAFEVKTQIGKATPNQYRFLENFDRAGGYACVIRSLEEAQEAFKEV